MLIKKTVKLTLIFNKTKNYEIHSQEISKLLKFHEQGMI